MEVKSEFAQGHTDHSKPAGVQNRWYRLLITAADAHQPMFITYRKLSSVTWEGLDSIFLWFLYPYASQGRNASNGKQVT